MVQLALNEAIAGLLRNPTANDDKYSRGVVGFITGSDRYPGAALLGIKAALATSIGMVKYIGSQRVQDLLLVAKPEIVCFDSTIQAGRANAWVIGSGVTTGDELQLRNSELVFLGSGAKAVIDAGALEYLDFARLKNHRLLLTPHYSEMSRLLNSLEDSRRHTAESVRENAELLVQQTAMYLGQSILLKGSQTLLADSSGQVRVIGPNSPHLAVAGSGDVLAGLLGAIAASNTSETSWLDIAELGVKLHSAAAELAAESGEMNASVLLDSLGILCRKLVD